MRTARLSPRAPSTSERRGNRKSSTPVHREAATARPMTEREHHHQRAPSSGAAPEASGRADGKRSAHSTPLHPPGSPRPRPRRSRVATPAHHHQLEEHGSSGFRSPAAEEDPRDDRSDPPRTRRYDHDPRREEHGLRDRVGNEDHRRTSLRPIRNSSMLSRSWVISSSAPNSSSISRRAGEKERARAIEAPAAIASRAPTGGGSRIRGELREVEHVPTRSCARAVPAHHLERQGDVLRHGAPVIEDRRLKGDAVVAIEPCPAGGLPFPVTSPPEGSTMSPTMRSSVDFPQPDGPSGRRTPFPTSRSMSWSAVTLPFPKTFVRPLRETTVSRVQTIAPVRVDSELLGEHHDEEEGSRAGAA